MGCSGSRVGSVRAHRFGSQMGCRVRWAGSSLSALAMVLLGLSGTLRGQEAIQGEVQQQSPDGVRERKVLPKSAPRKAGARSQPGAVVEVVGVAASVMQETRLDELSSPVSTVTSEQIEDLQAQDLPAALRRMPGVVVSRHNPVGSFGGGEGGSVFIRGMGISRPGAEIQILMDGVPRIVGVWTHPLMDVLSVDVMERVEVYKGAQPVLFGNSAFGALSITPKSQTEEAPNTSLELAGGSFGTVTEVLQHGGRKGSFDYCLVQSYRRSDGHREQAGGELQNYYGRFGYALSEHWKASLLLNGTDNWAADPGPADGSSPRQGRFRTRDLFAVVTLSHQHAGAQGHVKLYREDGAIRWRGQYNTGSQAHDVDTDTDFDNFGLRLKEALTPWKNGALILGLDLDFIGGDVENRVPPAPPNRFEESTFRILAPYLALHHTFGSREGWFLVPSAGARFMDHSEFGGTAGTQAGIAGGYRNTELHASFAHGVNYPGIYVKAQDQMFMPGDNRWRDLEPETVDHLECGISHRFGKRAKVDVNLFQDKGMDRIVVAPPPPFPPTFANQGEWKTRGVELSLSIEPRDDLALFAGGTYLEATPGDLPYAPRKTATMGANFRFLERFQLSADLLYVDGQFVTSRSRTRDTVNIDQVGAYALVNAKASWDFIHTSRWRGQAFLALENLGDRRYEQKKGYPMPGTHGLAGIKLQF